LGYQLRSDELKSSQLEEIRELRAWKVAIINLSLLIYDVLAVGVLTVVLLIRPELPLLRLFYVLFAITVVLVIVGWVCVAILTPYTSSFIGLGRDQAQLGAIGLLFRALFHDLGEAMRFSWVRRRRR
jgi:Kef-type K+ transport system membrane component KefB